MHMLLLADLQLGLDDLLTKRQSQLVSCGTGKTYLPLFQAKRDAIAALPPDVVGGRPLSEQLAEADLRHDAYGAAVYHLTEAYLRLARYEPAVAAEAEKIRGALIPGLSELRATFASQAASAKNRLKHLPEIEAQLHGFPVKGGDLLAWVKVYLEAGVKLDELMSLRADAAAQKESNRSQAGVLRSETIGLITRARLALGDELDANPSLPRNLDAQIFGYFDQLSEMRKGGGSPDSQEPEQPAEPEEPPVEG